MNRASKICTVTRIGRLWDAILGTDDGFGALMCKKCAQSHRGWVGGDTIGGVGEPRTGIIYPNPNHCCCCCCFCVCRYHLCMMTMAVIRLSLVSLLLSFYWFHVSSLPKKHRILSACLSRPTSNSEVRADYVYAYVPVWPLFEQ